MQGLLLPFPPESGGVGMSRDRGADEHFAPGRPAQPSRPNGADFIDGYGGVRVSTAGTLEGKRISVASIGECGCGECSWSVEAASYFSLDTAEHIAREILSQVAAARGEVTL